MALHWFTNIDHRTRALLAAPTLRTLEKLELHNGSRARIQFWRISGVSEPPNSKIRRPLLRCSIQHLSISDFEHVPQGFADWRSKGTALHSNVRFVNKSCANAATPGLMTCVCPFAVVYGMSLSMNTVTESGISSVSHVSAKMVTRKRCRWVERLNPGGIGEHVSHGSAWVGESSGSSKWNQATLVQHTSFFSRSSVHAVLLNNSV